MKKLLRKSISCISILTAASLTLTACDPPIIFEKKKDPYVLQELSVNDIQEDVYYVKSGTKFTAVNLPSGTVSGPTSQPDPNRIIWMDTATTERLIPALYKGDTIAIKSASLDVNEVSLERFKDCGYSIGVYGTSYNSDRKLIDLNYKSNVIDYTSAAVGLQGISDELHIASVAGKNVTEDMIDASGIMKNMEQAKTYEISYYSGTDYKTSEIKADLHMLESWELYDVKNIETTKRGYLSISLPDDLKSGWYLIDGKGLFKYIDHAKGDGPEYNGSELNDPYYLDEAESARAYSQVYSIDFGQRTVNPTVVIAYISGSAVGTPAASLIAPDGTRYAFRQSDTPPSGDKKAEQSSSYNVSNTDGGPTKYLLLPLEQAMSGQWDIYVTPRNLKVSDVHVVSNTLNEMTTQEVKEFTLDKDEENITFFARWKGAEGERLEDDQMFGYFIYPDGTTYMLKRDDDMQELHYDTTYIPKGTYQMVIYHYSNTTIPDNSYGSRPYSKNYNNVIISKTQ